MTDTQTNAATNDVPVPLDFSTLTTWQGFLTALKRLISSMKFWTFILTLLTALGAKYGFNVDASTFWSIVGLGGTLLGVQGATDWGKNATVAQNQSHARHTAKYGAWNPSFASSAVATFEPPTPKLLVMGEGGTVKVHMSDGTDHEIGDMLAGAGFVKSTIVRPGQAGFARLGVMLALCGVAFAAFLCFGCTTLKTDAKQAGGDIASCASAEADAVKKNISVVQVALDVVDIIAKLAANPAGEAESLLSDGITKYGEPIVACAFNKFEAAHQPATKTSQPDPRALAAKAQIDKRNWARFK